MQLQQQTAVVQQQQERLASLHTQLSVQGAELSAARQELEQVKIKKLKLIRPELEQVNEYNKDNCFTILCLQCLGAASHCTIPCLPHSYHGSALQDRRPPHLRVKSMAKPSTSSASMTTPASMRVVSALMTPQHL